MADQLPMADPKNRIYSKVRFPSMTCVTYQISIIYKLNTEIATSNNRFTGQLNTKEFKTIDIRKCKWLIYCPKQKDMILRKDQSDNQKYIWHGCQN